MFGKVVKRGSKAVKKLSIRKGSALSHKEDKNKLTGELGLTARG